MSLPVIVLGGGGHASVLVESLRVASVPIVGFTCLPGSDATHLHSIPHLGADDEVLTFPPAMVALVNGVGSTGRPTHRQQLFDRFVAAGYAFSSVIHPTAHVAASGQHGIGLQAMAGVVVQTNAVLGRNVIVNTKSSVDHDCIIGDHVHLAPGVTLCGGVRIGSGSHVGSGSTIIQGITIGHNCLIAAGSVVIRDVPDGKTVMGVPAKEVAR